MNKEENKIPAVYKEELESLLISVSELEPILDGQRNCSVCSRLISLDNIQFIIPRVNKVFEYVCNAISCGENHNSKGQ